MAGWLIKEVEIYICMVPLPDKVTASNYFSSKAFVSQTSSILLNAYTGGYPILFSYEWPTGVLWNHARVVGNLDYHP